MCDTKKTKNNSTFLRQDHVFLQ